MKSSYVPSIAIIYHEIALITGTMSSEVSEAGVIDARCQSNSVVVLSKDCRPKDKSRR